MAGRTEKPKRKAPRTRGPRDVNKVAEEQLIKDLVKWMVHPLRGVFLTRQQAGIITREVVAAIQKRVYK